MAVVLARGPNPSQNKSSQSRLKSGRYQPYAQAWQRSQRAVQTMKPHAATDQSAPNGHITHVREPQLGPSRCTRASFEPPRDPQLTSPAGPTGFARQRSEPAPAPSNLTQHTSLVAQHPVTLRALSLTAGPLLESLPGAKTISLYYSRR